MNGWMNEWVDEGLSKCAINSDSYLHKTHTYMSFDETVHMFFYQVSLCPV